MHSLDLLSERLRLVAITVAMVDAESEDPQRLAPLLQAHIPDSWPDSNWEPHVLAFIRQQHETQPAVACWNRYVVLPGSPATLIGTCCAFRSGEREAEIGYTILPPWQGHGYASEAARCLLQALFASGIDSVIAHTFPHLAASLRVMRKCGFVYDGPGEDGTVRYRITRLVR